MPRRRRTESSTSIHHVMNRGVDRAEIFLDDAGRIDFGRCLADCHERFEFSVLAYCLMGNHFHLVVRAPSGDLSRAMHRLGTKVARHTNDRAGRDGPLFRGRFLALPVDSAEYLDNVVRYVHRNPLDLLTTQSLVDYRWSSYRTYLGLRRPPRFLDTSIVLDRFGGDSAKLASFTEGDPDTGTNGHGRQLVRAMMRREIAATSASMGIDTVSLRESVVIDAVAHQLGPVAAEALGPLIPERSPGAARTARMRSARRLQSDPALRRVVERLSLELGHRPEAA